MRILLPKTIQLYFYSPIWARSDAQGRGRVAMRALSAIDVSTTRAFTEVVRGMAFAADAEPPIYLFELAATALTACEVACRIDNNRRTSVIRIDNEAAHAPLIKGSSPSAYEGGNSKPVPGRGTPLPGGVVVRICKHEGQRC